MNVLEVDSVFHSFEDKKILSDIYLTCKTGEIIGILGRNGCGKTTLLKIIFGILKADNQAIRINNNYYAKPFTHNNLIAYLPEHNFLPADLSVEKSISLFVDTISGMERVMRDSRVKSLLPYKIKNLSGGERRYLEIVLVIHLDRHFILLDEPFTGIEPLFQEKIREFIRENAMEKGFIITDHDYRNIIDVSDRFLLLRNGTVVSIKDEDELRSFHYLP